MGYQEEFLHRQADWALEGAAKGSGGIAILRDTQEMCGCGAQRHGFMILWLSGGLGSVSWMGGIDYLNFFFHTKHFWDPVLA